MSHRDNHKPVTPIQIALFIIGILLVISAAVLIGIAVGNRGQKLQAVQVKPIIQQMPAPTTSTDATESVQQKADKQKQLNDCIDAVNTQITNAMGTDTSNFKDPSAYEQGLLQLQQTSIAECQAKHPQN